MNSVRGAKSAVWVISSPLINSAAAEYPGSVFGFQATRVKGIDFRGMCQLQPFWNPSNAIIQKISVLSIYRDNGFHWLVG